jgi:hypothetical protein
MYFTQDSGSIAYRIEYAKASADQKAKRQVSGRESSTAEIQGPEVLRTADPQADRSYGKPNLRMRASAGKQLRSGE